MCKQSFYFASCPLFSKTKFTIRQLKTIEWKSKACELMLVQFQPNRLYQNNPFSISLYRGQILKSILYQSNYQIIENPVSKIFSLFAKFDYKIISTKMAPKPYIETLILEIAKYQFWKSSYRKYRTSKPYQTYKSQIPYRTSTNVNAVKYYAILVKLDALFTKQSLLAKRFGCFC